MAHFNGDGCIYEFGRFRVNCAERQLLRGDQPVALASKVFDTLLVLIQHSGHVLKKDELMRAVWPDGFVEEVNLAHNISVLRKALSAGEDNGAQTYIETVPRIGYRFVARVIESTNLTPSPLGEGWGGVVKRRTNLPAQMTSFIGREGEIADLAARVNTTRLLTLTGAGGCGKTRLALEVASRAQNDFDAGAWLVELASITDESLVPRAVGSIFGLTDQPGTSPLEVLTNYLASKRLLLIVDNCEHVIGACAALIHHLLRNCPHLHMLATSREALHVAGEVNWRVPSLTTPDSAHPHRPPFEQALNFEAVRLFAERARAIQPGFDLSPRNVDAVIGICHQLGGMPLAIELAAARLNALSPEQIAARLSDRFSLLTSGVRTALPRHQTLRATIAWSVDLLSEPERELLARLSVFAGGFAADAAQAISNQPNTLDMLSSLVDKSLVIADVHVEHARYSILETIRQYAAEQLAHAGQTSAAQERHYDVFLRLAEQAEPLLQSAHREPWLAHLDLELDNLRAALAWCRESGDAEALLRLASALWWFWNLRGHMGEGRRWLEEGLAKMGTHGDAALRAKALYVAGSLAWLQNDYEAAYRQNFESVQLLREQGNQRDVAYALARLALAASKIDDDLACAAGAESVTILNQLGDRWGLALALDFHAIALRRRDVAAARVGFETSASLFRELGDGWGIAMTSTGLGYLCLTQDDCANARIFFSEAATLRATAKDKAMTASSLVSLGEVAERQGDYHNAIKFYQQALLLDWGIGNRLKALERLEHIASLDALRGDFERCVRLSAAVHTLGKHDAIHMPDLATVRTHLGAVTFTEAWVRGSAMTLDEAVEFALSEGALQTGASR